MVGGAEVLAAVVTAPLLRRRYLRWGTVPSEFAAALPGDELVRVPQLGYTRAVTVDAPVADVWPWLVQIGQGRGGLYSFDGLENLIGCDIHPLHNVAVLNRLRKMGTDEDGVNAWIGHWISEGLAAVEALIGDDGFCFGAQPGLADVYLLPQLYAARRFAVDLASYPRILRVERLALEHPAFRTAHPDAQADKPA